MIGRHCAYLGRFSSVCFSMIFRCSVGVSRMVIAITGNSAKTVAIHSIGENVTVSPIKVNAPPSISTLSTKGRFLADGSIPANLHR